MDDLRHFREMLTMGNFCGPLHVSNTNVNANVDNKDSVGSVDYKDNKDSVDSVDITNVDDITDTVISKRQEFLKKRRGVQYYAIKSTTSDKFDLTTDTHNVKGWVGHAIATFEPGSSCNLDVILARPDCYITKIEIIGNDGHIFSKMDEKIMTLFNQLSKYKFVSLAEFIGMTADYPWTSSGWQLIVYTNEPTDVQLSVNKVAKVDNNYSRLRMFYRSFVTEIDFAGCENPFAELFNYRMTWALNVIMGFYIWFEQSDGELRDIFDIVEYLEIDLSDIRCKITKESVANPSLQCGKIRFIDIYGVVDKEPWKLETWYRLCHKFLFLGRQLIEFRVTAAFIGSSIGRVVIIIPDLNVTIFSEEKTIDIINH